jgi:hypothetical protein
MEVAMTYNVLVKQSNSRFMAIVLGLPQVMVEATTRQGAIQKAHDAAVKFMADSEIVQIEVGKPTIASRPLASFAGMWADDETFDDFALAMKQYRAVLNSDSAQL